MLVPGLGQGFQPLITDDTGTQGARGNQIEVAYSRAEDKEAGVRTVTHYVPLVYTRGITDALDLYAGSIYQRIAPPGPSSDERGWSNTAIGAKWRFYENEARIVQCRPPRDAGNGFRHRARKPCR